MKLETKTRLRELTSKYFLLNRSNSQTNSVRDELDKLVAPLLPESVHNKTREVAVKKVVEAAISMASLLPPTSDDLFGQSDRLRSYAFVAIIEMIEFERSWQPQTSGQITRRQASRKKTKNVRMTDDRMKFENLKWEKKKLEEWNKSISAYCTEMQNLCENESTQEMWRDLMPIEAYLFGQKISEEYVHNRFLEDTVIACKTFLSALVRDLALVDKRLSDFNSDLNPKGGWSDPSRQRIRLILQLCDLNHIPLHKIARKVACVLYEAAIEPIRSKRQVLPPSHIKERLTDQILKVYLRDPRRPDSI